MVKSAGFVYIRGRIWWVQYSYGGKRHRESSCSQNRTDAERLLRKRLYELDEGKIPSAFGERLRFEDLAEGIRKDYEINKRKSTDRLELSLKHLADEFRGKKASDISTLKIQAYIEKRLGKGAAPGTVNRELTALKRAFNLARISGKLSIVPYIPMLRENNAREGFIERDQFLVLYDNLPDYLKAPVMFLYNTGFRKSETFTLTWDKVNLRDGWVRLERSDTKTKEGRTVYLPSESIAALREAHKRRVLGCPWVFHRDGNQLKDPRKSWDKACKIAGVPGLLFHDLRRSAVRNMIRAGIPERVVMQISGHKTRSMLDRYNIVSEQDLRDAAKKLDSYYLRTHGAC